MAISTQIFEKVKNSRNINLQTNLPHNYKWKNSKSNIDNLIWKCSLKILYHVQEQFPLRMKTLFTMEISKEFTALGQREDAQGYWFWIKEVTNYILEKKYQY